MSTANLEDDFSSSISTKKMRRTDEQQALIDSVVSGECACGEALAGCGKTTIIIESANDMPKRKLELICFNVRNAEEVNSNPKKPSNLTAYRFHQKCLRTLGRVNVKVKSFTAGKWTNGKNEDIIRRDPIFDSFNRALSKDEKISAKENFDAADQCLRLLKNTYVDPSFTDVINLMNRYQISPSMPRDEFANKILSFLRISDEDQYNVDYDDMIRFCVLRGLGSNIISDVFAIDEAQDNTPMRTMLMKQMQENSQVVFIGDRRQAIYAFAGSDCKSMENIINLLDDVKLLPLTINFRCDKNIIREAQKLVPDIKYLESKEDGIVTHSEMKDLHKHLQPGDVGISRYNRVIIPECFKLIRSGKPATIQGADFGKMLKSQISGFKATSMDDFYTRLNSWYDKQCKYSEECVSDATTERFACLKFLADNSDTVEDIARTIEGIFSDKTHADTYMFSTGHRSKGLEWDRVHILDSSNFICRREGITAEQAQQELNIMYIAQTRARHFLNFVS